MLFLEKRRTFSLSHLLSSLLVLLSLACLKVVEEIFRERINRDVVFHSGKLLQFLCGMEEKLTVEHIDLIWSSCIKESSAELQVRAKRWRRAPWPSCCCKIDTAVVRLGV